MVVVVIVVVVVTFLYISHVYCMHILGKCRSIPWKECSGCSWFNSKAKCSDGDLGRIRCASVVFGYACVELSVCRCLFIELSI